MSSTLVLTTIVVFGFIVGSFLQRFQKPNFIFSGIIYVIFGIALGPMGFDILSAQFISRLEPLTSLLIGIVGYLLGLRVKDLFRSRSIFITGLLSANLVFMVVAGVFFLVSPYFLPENLFQIEFYPFSVFGESFQPSITVNQLWFCIGIGATACSASLLNLGTQSRVNDGDSEITRALSLMTKAVQCIAVVFMGICLANARAPLLAEKAHLSMPLWMLASVFSGIVCGLLFSFFIGKQSNSDRVLLAALGTIIFASGIGISMGISALFVAFITGATISFVSSYSGVLRENLTKIETPIFVLLLILGGAMWKPELSHVWALPFFYFVARFMVVSFVPQLIYKGVNGKELTRLGQGMLGQDLMAVAIAISFAQQFPDIAQVFLTTILGSIFINDFFADRFLKRVILDNELKTSVEVIETKEGSP